MHPTPKQKEKKACRYSSVVELLPALLKVISFSSLSKEEKSEASNDEEMGKQRKEERRAKRTEESKGKSEGWREEGREEG